MPACRRSNIQRGRPLALTFQCEHGMLEVDVRRCALPGASRSEDAILYRLAGGLQWATKVRECSRARMPWPTVEPVLVDGTTLKKFWRNFILS